MKRLSDFVMIGKSPPPVYGTTVWYDVVLKSTFIDEYGIRYFDASVNTSIHSLSIVSIRKIQKYIMLVLKYLALLAKCRPKYVHMTISQSVGGILKDSAFVLLSAMAARKLIVHLHGSAIDEVVARAPMWIRWYIKYVCRIIDVWIVLSPRFVEIVKRVGAKDVHVVRNGCDLTLPERKKVDRSFNMLYLGNLQPSKGIEDVLKAADMLQKNGANYTLHIGGSWRDDETKRIFDSLCKNGNIHAHYHGPVFGDKKWNLFSQADVFIFTPREREGHPWVINEALAAGLPIIATAKGMIEDAVRDEFNGFIVKDRDPLGIYVSIMRMIEDPMLRSEMSERSKLLYKENYTLDIMLEEMRAVFNHCLASS